MQQKYKQKLSKKSLIIYIDKLYSQSFILLTIKNVFQTCSHIFCLKGKLKMNKFIYTCTSIIFI